MLVLQISAHTPDDCPAFNEKSKKTMVALMQSMESLPAKHDVKSLGVWTDLGAHTIYQVFETRSLDAYWALLREPELMDWLSFNKVENRVVVGREEVQAILARS
jgi:hypothetical protein